MMMAINQDDRVDLHTHTTASDGLLRPSALVREAVSLGLAAIAITDHDTVGAYEEARRSAQDHDIKIIPAIELSASLDSKEIHLLGYFIDPNHRLLTSYLGKVKKSRIQRANAIIQNLNAYGHSIDFEHVLAYTENGVIARPHIAEAMVERGIVYTYLEAFDRWIGDGKPACVEKRNETTESVIQLIHSLDGVAILAHPGANFSSALLQSLIDAGLDGIEAIHPRHSTSTQNYFKRYALSNDLISTGGSDYHGGRKINELLGSCSVTYKVVEQLYAQHQEIKRKNLQN